MRENTRIYPKMNLDFFSDYEKAVSKVLSEVMERMRQYNFAYIDEALSQLNDETPILIRLAWIRGSFPIRGFLHNWSSAAHKLKKYVDDRNGDPSIYQGLIE